MLAIQSPYIVYKFIKIKMLTQVKICADKGNLKLALSIGLVAMSAFAGAQASHDLGHVRPGTEPTLELTQSNPWLPPGVSIYPSRTPVVGKLGELPFTFPADFVRGVQYEGDPGIGEKRAGPTPMRTHQSKLVSLGFDVRYPNIEVIKAGSPQDDRHMYSVFNTQWIRVGLTAGSDFGDGLFLERLIGNINDDKAFQYQKLNSLQYGLEVYTPVTVDVTKRRRDPISGAYKSDIRDRDFFVKRGADKRITTVIRCSNRDHEAAPCDHRFYLNSKLARTEVRISYRRGMLINWSDIENKTERLIMSFKSKQ